jgi:Enoyl-(Acyl carrier protein) reductase
MSGLFDVSKEIILVTGASQGKLTKRIPQRRVGAEADLDGAIMPLASNASRYMTGSVVTVDGGFLLN